VDSIGVVTDMGTLVVAVVGIWIAITQLRSANRDAHASRMADMSWQVYQAYVDPRLRDARVLPSILLALFRYRSQARNMENGMVTGK
jgi:hypothetical protein